MAFDVEKFASDIGMAAEDRTQLDALFGKYPKAKTAIDTFIGSELEARLSPLKTEYEKKQADLDAQFDTLASIRGGDEQAIKAAEQRAEKLASDMAVLKTRMERIGTDAGIDVTPYLKDIVIGEPKVDPQKTEPPTFDTAKLMNDVNRVGLSAFENAALMEDLATEHQLLFGKPMSRVELIQTLKDTVKRTGNPNLGLRDVFDTKFNVAARRAELAEQQVQERIKAEVEKATTAVRDELALRGPQGEPTTFSGSPALQLLTADRKPTVINGQNEAVRAAIADWTQRKRAQAS